LSISPLLNSAAVVGSPSSEERRVYAPLADDQDESPRSPRPGIPRDASTSTADTIARSIWATVQRFPDPANRSDLEELAPRQTFEGTVLSVENGEFRARLRDISDPSRPDETAKFSMDEVAEDDIRLVEPGGIFYWIFFQQRKPSIRNSDEIRFRRLPQWSRGDVVRMEETARELMVLLEDCESLPPNEEEAPETLEGEENLGLFA
jgi:hypothetical protein